MRLHSDMGSMQLLHMLEEALRKERSYWKPNTGRSQQKNETEVVQEQRDEMVRWLTKLSDKFHFHPETFALGVSLLDRFLQCVKARPKYAQCIAVSCLYLAAKTLEEDEVIPGSLDYVVDSQSGCTVAEVLRMERIILDKLHWDLLTVTAIDFLHIFHALLLTKHPYLLNNLMQMTPSRQLSLMTQKLKHCLAQHQLLAFKPSTLALALVSLELELFATNNWLPVTVRMQQLVKVDNVHLIRCREIISRHLASSRHINTVYIYSTLKDKATKRKVDQLEDEEDVSESIKRLYNEEGENSLGHCGSEFRQELDENSSPLQAVSVK
ncbi:cyclin-I [Lingula anatina]|uniref:Cyclin-I n=1 Tax=Lingula anatina TaxID=7574 RepID=A0A1S3KBM6_LINAN|nr:cyclin-I [Lingula anatina]|eukprot:XP_013420038.1 cyclin-I [Lingula anatina]